ncbi:MAG: DUF2334 domain-containing protein [Chloroflexota bacterium]|nr:DUF2334 domain-containing protein [Chloroflexota bacterium]
MGSGPKKAIISLHDVAPPFEGAIRAQLEYLAGAGIRRCVLMVVPDWHGEHSILESPSLLALLHRWVEAGSQIVLHGVQHREHGVLGGSTWSRFRGSVFAPGAAEFLTFEPKAAIDAVTRGLEVLEAAGFPRTSWFCPPGWLLREDVRVALPDAGIRYVVNMLSIDDLTTQRRYAVPATGYMGASRSQELGIRFLNGIVEQTWVRVSPTIQVYVHPQADSDGSVAGRRILGNAVDLVERGRLLPATYDELYGGDGG